MNRSTVVVVDDDAPVREVIIDAVAPYFDEVIECVDGKDAFTKLAGLTPDLIISDFHMPGLNGQEFLGHVRANGLHCPVIFVTANANIDFVISLLRMGASDLIEKPFEPDALVESMKRVIEIERIRQRLYSKTSENPSAERRLMGLMQKLSSAS